MRMSCSHFFYISTPLYYVNDRPHLGTAYSTIIADILNRYHKLLDYETFFLTGTDEHGQKCEQAAKARGVEPELHCAEMREHFKTVWQKLNIEYNAIGEEDQSFFYTSHKYQQLKEGGTPPNHSQTVQSLLQKIKDKGDIYLSQYKGWYCVSEEIFYTEKDLIDGKSPSGKEVIPLQEKAWFFKMSKYQDLLIRHLETHPQFIRPIERQNEIKAFLKKPLKDLCVSRPKSRVQWGIELSFDKSSVVYVWVDALLNYITGLGYGAYLVKEDYIGKEEDKTYFENFWNRAGAIHLIGKDILMTHAVYWPCLLMALDLKLPKSIFAHGWLLNRSDKKMSKSQGDKLDPLELSDILGVDGLRYFLAKNIFLGKDSAISKELMIQKCNEDLSDNLGNIFSRVSRLIEKHFEGKVPRDEIADQKIKQMTEELFFGNLKTKAGWKERIEKFELSQALEDLFGLLTELNRYLEREAPWKLLKSQSGKKRAGQVLWTVIEALRICALFLFPIMPGKMTELLSQLGMVPSLPEINPALNPTTKLNYDGQKLSLKHTAWGSFPFDWAIKCPSIPLFPKIR